MIEMTGTIFDYAIWAAQIFYFVSFIPQIVLNYRLKSSSGLSDLYVLAFFNGYVAEFFYAYCLGFPLAYKLMIPLSTIAIGILVVQRFYYASSIRAVWYLGAVYLLNIGFFMALVPYAWFHAIAVGHGAGWAAVGIWCTYQIPQLTKNYRLRSVHGFSFALASFIAAAAFIECISAFVIGLPAQTIIYTARGVLVYLIFVTQFWLFK